MTKIAMYKKYQLVEKAIYFFVKNQPVQPSLEDLSQYLGVSEFHVQRVFSEWVGLSPKQFLQYLTKESAKAYLNDMSVNAASIESGLSGSGRLHDLMIHCEGMTPGEYKKQGEGLQISYGMSDSPFGLCFIAQTARGICKLAFCNSKRQFASLEEQLQQDWPKATFIREHEAVDALVSKIFFRAKCFSDKPQSLRVLLKGSPFQIKVWEALLSIPEGQICSYQNVADKIGSPSSVRAVASAIGKNDIGYLIPCHRVIRSSGAFSHYRWKPERKMAMIAWELSHHNDLTKMS